MIELTKLLNDLSATTKITEKKKLIKDINEDTKKLFILTYNTFITYGVKKIPEYTSHAQFTTDTDDLSNFFELCDKLASRELSGNAALQEISAVLSGYTTETADVLAKVLRRDLKVVLGRTNINKVHKKLIPVFKCMLADKMDHRFNWNMGPWLVEYKYDGMRILAHVTETVEYLSREGNIQHQYEGVFDEELLAMRDIVGHDVYVDGEIISGNFNDTMKARKVGSDQSNSVFWAWDMLSAMEWDAAQCNATNINRRRYLESIVSTNKNVKMSHAKICKTKDELMDFYSKLVENGAEGVIVKDMNAMYTWTRNRAWTKFKPVYDADMKILGRYSGKEHSKYEHTLGGLMLEGVLEDGTFVIAKCGSGFSDKQRDDIWEMDLDELLSWTAEIKYGDVSDVDGKATSLKFPTFRKFRLDKTL